MSDKARKSRRGNSSSTTATSTRNKGVSGRTISITSKKESKENSTKPIAIPSSSQSSSSDNEAASASATKAPPAPAPAVFVEKDLDTGTTVTSTREVLDEEEGERIQPDAIPSNSSINGSRRKQESGGVKHEDIIRPCSVSSSNSSCGMAAGTANQSSTHDTDANTSNKREKKKKTTASPVAFVEKDFIEGEGEAGAAGTAPLPETITSSDISTGYRAEQKTTKKQCNDDNNNNDGVAIKKEDSLTADNDTNNNQKKRRKQGSGMTPIKSEELLHNNDDANYTNRSRRSRRKRKQYPSEEDSTNSSDRLKAKKKRKNNQQRGEPAVVINNARRTSPRRNKKHHEEEEEEEEDHKDNSIDSNNEDHNSTNSNNGTKNCCKLCTDPDWENKIYYKCGTVLTKYFPKSNNNHNPGWYKGTIRMHHFSSANSGSSSDSDSEYEDEAESSSEEESEQPHPIIYNEINYEDGDMENITQDDLKLQLMDSRKLKILHPTKMETASNSERQNRVDVVPLATSSDNKYDRKWLENYHRLKEFKNEKGNCRVPKNYGPDPSLGYWVSTQRKVYKKGKLAEDRAEKLNKIGFDWDPFDQTQDEMFCRLEQFRTENGHCRVPIDYGPDPSLALWVRNQRSRRGNMAPHRLEKLDNIGFDWDPHNQTWDEMFGRLKRFKAKNGHCRVPATYGPDPSLGKWVHNQRHRKGNVAKDRVEKLNKIGFDWDTLDQTWDEMFGRLEKFKAENGHCRVPVRYSPDAILGRWVSWQRQLYKKGLLAPVRQQKLEEIDFEWSLRT